MRTSRNFAVLLTLFLLSGCASITAGTTQSIAVDTQPQRAAECRLSNEKGSWSIRTPGVTTITKAYGPLSATCTTADGWGGSTAVQSTTAGAAFGNILAGGIIGAAVDMSSGAAYVYPAQVFVPIAPGGRGAAALNPSTSSDISEPRKRVRRVAKPVPPPEPEEADVEQEEDFYQEQPPPIKQPNYRPPTRRTNKPD